MNKKKITESGLTPQRGGCNLNLLTDICYVLQKLKKDNTMSATKFEEARKYIIEKDLQGISEKLMRGLLLTRPTDINATCI